jgi:AcrR family transcriptional regulator
VTPSREALFDAALAGGIERTREAILAALDDPGLPALCRARFRQGAEEHGDDWLAWPARRFHAERAHELADSVNYTVMEAVAEAVREGAA